MFPALITISAAHTHSLLERRPELLRGFKLPPPPSCCYRDMDFNAWLSGVAKAPKCNPNPLYVRVRDPSAAVAQNREPHLFNRGAGFEQPTRNILSLFLHATRSKGEASRMARIRVVTKSEHESEVRSEKSSASSSAFSTETWAKRHAVSHTSKFITFCLFCRHLSIRYDCFYDLTCDV